MNFSCKKSLQQSSFCCRQHVDDVVDVASTTPHSSCNIDDVCSNNVGVENEVDNVGENIHHNSCTNVNQNNLKTNKEDFNDNKSFNKDSTVNNKPNGIIKESSSLVEKCSISNDTNHITSECQSTRLLNNNKNESIFNNHMTTNESKSLLNINNDAEVASLLNNNSNSCPSNANNENELAKDERCNNIIKVNDTNSDSSDNSDNNDNCTTKIDGVSQDNDNNNVGNIDENSNTNNSNNNISISDTTTSNNTATTSATATAISTTNKIVNINNTNKELNNGDNSTKNKKSNLKKKSLTLFSKSSRIKDFLLNKNSKKHTKNKGGGGDFENNKNDNNKDNKDNNDLVGNSCSASLLVKNNGNNNNNNNSNNNNDNDNNNSNNDRLKSIFRINKKKLSILHLPNNKNNKNTKNNISNNNNNNNNQNNSHNSNTNTQNNNTNNNITASNDNDDEKSGNSNSSSSIVTPSPTTFHHTTNNNITTSTNNNIDDNNRPVSFDIRTRNLPEIPNDGLRGGIRSAEITQQQQLTLQQQQQQSSSSAAIVESDVSDPFIESFNDLKNKGWYWGPLSWKEAEDQLKDKPIGSFLVRDSSDERYILSLSFKSEDQTHHTRIEHYRGQFSFNAQPRSHGAATIVEFIEKAIENCTDGSFSYFLRPKGPGLPPTMVRLTNPVSRLMKTHSLQHLCRFVVLSQIRRDLIESLPVPNLIKAYLACNQYYVEGD